MSKKNAILVMTVLVFFTTIPLKAEKIYKLYGIVINKKDHKPMEKANISLVGLPQNTFTDKNGNFELFLENVTDIKMRVTKEGFKTFELRVNLPLSNPLEIELEPEFPPPDRDDLEGRLKAVNIHLTDIKEKIETVRSWLKDPYSGYINLTKNVLKLLNGKKPKGNSIPLDTISGKYKVELGLEPNYYLRSYDNTEVLKRAYVMAWKDKNSGLHYDSFEEITGISAIKWICWYFWIFINSI